MGRLYSARWVREYLPDGYMKRILESRAVPCLEDPLQLSEQADGSSEMARALRRIKRMAMYFDRRHDEYGKWHQFITPLIQGPPIIFIAQTEHAENDTNLIEILSEQPIRIVGMANLLELVTQNLEGTIEALTSKGAIKK